MNALSSKAGHVIKRTKNQDKEMNDSIVKLYDALNFIQQTQQDLSTAKQSEMQLEA